MLIEHLNGSKFEVTVRGESLVLQIPTMDGEAPDGVQPVELLLAALGTCMLSSGVEFLRRQGDEVPSAAASLEIDDVVASRPIRVGSIDVSITTSDSFSEKQTAQFLRAASRCKVHNTLLHPPEVKID